MDTKTVLRMCAGVASALILFLCGWTGRTASADIGWPPVNPSGSTVGVEPGFTTNVRMVAEEVNLVIEEHQRNAAARGEDSPADWMRARVEAEFLMRNLGQESESFDVWFPLASSVRYPGLLR